MEENIKRIEEIKKQLNDYFNYEPVSKTSNRGLEILDGEKPAAGGAYYTGVTIPYILKYVLKDKYKTLFERALVYFCILDMLGTNLAILYCTHVGRLVIESLKFPTGHHYATLITTKEGNLDIKYRKMIIFGEPYQESLTDKKNEKPRLLLGYRYIKRLLNKTKE